MKWIKILFVTFLLGGCCVGPNYTPPPNSLPSCWSSQAEPFLIADSQPPCHWWSLFNDPRLQHYIELASVYNQDLLIAQMAIWQARAVRQVTASAFFPQIGALLNAGQIHFSRNGLFFPNQGDAISGFPSSNQLPYAQSIYNALIDASWEIDLFGKTRRAVERDSAQIGKAIEQRNDLLISILAEVALNYIDLRSYQQRALLIGENIKLLETYALITRKRLQLGYTNRLNLERIEAEIAQNQANLPEIAAQIYQTIYALSFLTGTLPEHLLCDLLPIQPLPTPPKEMTIGLRSDLIRRRPDIRQAERALAAATANIGVAVASFFPSFSFFGILGFQSKRLSTLFQSQSATWLVDGNLSIPIYQGGRLTGNLKISEAQAGTAAIRYQQKILQAVQESESAIATYTEETKVSDKLTEAVKRYQEIVVLTQQRHEKGLIDLTTLLDNERQLNQSQQNLLTSHTSLLKDLIILFKALGGGWEYVL